MLSILGRASVSKVTAPLGRALVGTGLTPDAVTVFGTVASVLDFALARLTNAGPDALIRTPLSGRRTHGWERPYEGWSGGEHCSAQTIGHTGFTGTGLWLDFERGHAWTLLTNRVHPTRHFDSGIVPLRRAVGDAINAE